MKLEVIEKKPSKKLHSTPILFVHGMWHGAWCWAEHFLPYFADHGYRVYALSLRGHGKSEGREKLRWTTVSGYVADVAQVVKELEKPPVLVGHSMGGMIVQKYIETHKCPAAVLMASVPPRGVISTTMRILSRHPLAFLKCNLTFSMLPVVATPQLAQEAFFSADMPEKTVKRYFSKLQDDSFRIYLDMLGLNLPKPKKVKTPVLVLGAADDTIFSVAQIEATARAYGAEMEIFPNMAHDMMLEAGWQAVADRILKWLKKKSV